LLSRSDHMAKAPESATHNVFELFVLLLRYSGLRIGDATQLEIKRLNGNKLLLHTQKTGVPVYCVVPSMVVEALEAAPRSSDQYFFWTGESTVHSAKGKWQHRLQRLFEFAKVPGGHPHRFRDTFAVELLLAAASASRNAITHRGRVLAKNKLRPISGPPGTTIL
jgi:integrase